MKLFSLLGFLIFTFFAQSLLAKAPQLSHGIPYHNHIEVNDYLVSEKLDGVRAYWNGTNLVSRKGNMFHSPEWFTASFPSQELDGELWISRGTFEKVVSTVRKKIP